MGLNKGLVDLILTLKLSVIYLNCTMCGLIIQHWIFIWLSNKIYTHFYIHIHRTTTLLFGDDKKLGT